MMSIWKDPVCEFVKCSFAVDTIRAHSSREVMSARMGSARTEYSFSRLAASVTADSSEPSVA